MALGAEFGVDRATGADLGIGSQIWVGVEGLRRRGVAKGAEGAVLAGADLSDIEAEGAPFVGADLTDVDLAGAFLAGSDLSGAGLTGANISADALDDVILQGTTCPDGFVTGDSCDDHLIE